MHQNPILTHKVSIEVSYIKVVHKDRFSQFFNLNISNLNLITVSGVENITNFKIALRHSG